MSDIKIVKLITGEEILCTIISKGSSKNETKLKHPILVIRGDEEQLSFQPYMPFAEIEYLEVNNSAIMFKATPTEKLGEAYLNMTGEIIVPPKPEIVT